MKKAKKMTARQAKIKKIMHEFKVGTLHGGRNPKGPKKAPIVTKRSQAIAIALNQAGVARRSK